MKLILLLTVSLLAGLSQLEAATIPYTNNFDGTGTNTAFPVEDPDGEWSVSGGAYQYDVTATNNVPSIASLPITNAAGTSFTLQTQFTVDSVGTINAPNTLGFGLFGGDTAFTATSVGTAYYLADFAYADNGAAPGEGVLRILSLGDSAGFTATPTSVDDNAGSTILAVNLGTTYTLRLQATYVGTTLNMTLGVFDAAGTTQIGGPAATATASDTSPLTGTNFGYRNRRAQGGGTTAIDFDNYSIVPEPSTFAMLLGGFGMLLGFQRSRRRR